MFNVSDEFLWAVKQPVIEYYVAGNIGTGGFTEANVVRDSFKITNQCTDTSDVILGSVYVGQLEATFVDIDMGFSEWIGKTITPTLSLRIGSTYEIIPLGHFNVAEATHSAEGVHIIAYDNMAKFDRKFKKSHFRYTGTVSQYLQQCCDDCGVTLAMTPQEIATFANYNEAIDIFGIYGKYKSFNNDIDTYRDILFWIAQTMGAFATINRDGNLVLRKYNNTIVDTITEAHRLEGATFEDYITNYTGIFVADMRYGTEAYYGYDVQELQAEIAVVTMSITQTEDAIAELEYEYEHGQITEEEYLAQKSILTKELKQLKKRKKWLDKALASAQAGSDGTYMDLGENPILQAYDATKRERTRRAVLSALDPISYTPFECNTIMGAHYDLGDVIYFTGGHTGSDGCFCCVMSYEFTLNGEYTMQGFGVNPALEATRSREQKTAVMANANAMTAKEISSGYNLPASDDGKEDDIYIKYGDKTTYTENYPLEYWGWADYPSEHTSKPSDFFSVYESGIDEDTGYFYAKAQGFIYKSLSLNGNFGMPVFKVDFGRAGKYKFVCDAKWSVDDATTGWWFNTKPGISNECHATNIDEGPPSTQLSFTSEDGEWHTYQTASSRWYDVDNADLASQNYVWFKLIPQIDSDPGKTYVHLEIRNARFEYVTNTSSGETDGGRTEHNDHYVDAVYVREEQESGGGGGSTLTWKNIEYVAGADTSALSGLSLNYKRWLSLTPEVMRAWFKADPPQAKQSFNRFCVRYTGKPDTDIGISLQSNTGWLNKSIKEDSEGVFTLKSGGTVSSGSIEYCAYKLTGLISGQKYYFNFKVNFANSATFGNDYTKGLGLVFNTTGVINTDSWTGDPDTFDETNLYYSMRRTTSAYIADFSFTATADTMYMCVVVADVTSGVTTSLTMSKMVISKTARGAIRNLYIYDLVSKSWLPYKPFGSGSDGGDADVSTLGDLDDVNLDNLQNGDALVYDSETGEWVNGDAGVSDYPDLTNKPSVNSVTLTGNKTTRDLNIIQKMHLADFELLPTADKNNPDKFYFVDDAGGSGGGGGGGGGGSAIYSGTTDPDDSVGNNDDLYLKYVAGAGISRIFGKISNAWLPFDNFIEYDWDFTRSLNAVNNGTAITLDGGASRSASGISFSEADNKADIPPQLLQKGYTYEITIASLSITTTSSNNRVFMFTTTNAYNAGFYWQGSSGKWVVWDNVNSTQRSEISDAAYFNNSVLKIVIDNDGKWHIYKNDTLIFEPPLALPLQNTAFALGASSNACNNMTISRFRIYPNEV